MYKIKRFSRLSQKEYGLGKFIKKVLWTAFRPKNIGRRIGYGLTGALIGGPIGYLVGRVIAGGKNWADANDKFGHSFADSPDSADQTQSYYQQEFSDDREDANPELIEKAKTSGVIQKVGNYWRIVSIKKGKLWNAKYQTREKAAAALRGYQANKH